MAAVHPTPGFDHFDQAHTENFCTSVLLLAMEVDDRVREVVEEEVRAVLPETPSLGALRTLRRELRTEADDEGWSRPDIWMTFDTDQGPLAVVVEVKTHSGWDPDEVKDQLARHGRTGRAARGGGIAHVVLLAPQDLCDAVGAPFITWEALLQRLRGLRPLDALPDLALQHLERHVHRGGGIPDMKLTDLDRVTSTVACLRAFLQSCIDAVGGRYDTRALWLTGQDGEPLRADGWAYHGLSVPFRLDGAQHRLGIYRYVETPEGCEDGLEGHWLELDRGEEDESRVELRFDPADLSAKELARFRKAFIDEWTRVQESASR